jgi:hypothetical protein
MTIPPTLGRVQALAYERALMPEPRFGWLAIHETEPGHSFRRPGQSSPGRPISPRWGGPVLQRGRALSQSEREPCLGWGASTPGRGGRGAKGFGKGCSTRMRLAVSRL